MQDATILRRGAEYDGAGATVAGELATRLVAPVAAQAVQQLRARVERHDFAEFSVRAGGNPGQFRKHRRIVGLDSARKTIAERDGVVPRKTAGEKSVPVDPNRAIDEGGRRGAVGPAAHRRGTFDGDQRKAFNHASPPR